MFDLEPGFRRRIWGIMSVISRDASRSARNIGIGLATTK
jgi:hypothetical protein